MADDLEDLKARVAAARDRLTNDVDFAQKVELRLNDLARIVEGSLARQSARARSRSSAYRGTGRRSCPRPLPVPSKLPATPPAPIAWPRRMAICARW